MVVGLSLISYSFIWIRLTMPDQISEPIVAQLDIKPQTAKTAESTESKIERIRYDPYPVEGDLIGSISLPSLNLIWPIFQGTEKSQLALGVGHHQKSVLPGEQDNSVLAGHRETVFNRLGELEIGEIISITTAAGTFDYQIREFRVVKRTDRTVIVPTPNAVLTLVTCYPFNYIGTTNRSYIVVADLINSQIN